MQIFIYFQYNIYLDQTDFFSNLQLVEAAKVSFLVKTFSMLLKQNNSYAENRLRK